MNVYFDADINNVIKDTIAGLVDRLNIKKIYLVYATASSNVRSKSEWIERYSKLKNCNIAETYWYSDIATGNYSGYVYALDSLPVDEKLIKSMTTFEPTIIKMMERNRAKGQKAMSYEERIRLYHVYLKYWNHMLDAAKINAAFFIACPHVAVSMTVYALCKIKDIPCVIKEIGPFQGFSSFIQDINKQNLNVYFKYKQLAEKYKNTHIDDIHISHKEISKNYSRMTGVEDDKSPFYMKKSYQSKISHTPNAYHKSIRKTFVQKLKLLISWNSRKQATDDNKILFDVYDALSIPVDLTSKPYFYYALHYQPELTTNPMGGVYAHQFLPIQMISYYLPDGMMLYVKEHPMQEYYCREIQIYYDIAKLHNVRLMPREMDTFQLIKNCVGVASVTGTVGLEGMLMGKPFLMFGSQINTYAPGTFNIRTNKDCKKAINQIIDYGPKHTPKDMKVYLRAIEEEIQLCGFWDHPETLKNTGLDEISYEENIKRLVDGYAKVLEAQTNTSRPMK